MDLGPDSFGIHEEIVSAGAATEREDVRVLQQEKVIVG
jgi:hypothetical protein